MESILGNPNERGATLLPVCLESLQSTYNPWKAVF